MKKVIRYPIASILLILAVLLVGQSSVVYGQAGSPDSGDAQGGKAPDYAVGVYRVGNVLTKEDRTAVARTGADIEEIGADYVLVRAVAQEASQIAKLGYPVEAIAQPMDFPPADAGYHNYAEMVT